MSEFQIHQSHQSPLIPVPLLDLKFVPGLTLRRFELQIRGTGGRRNAMSAKARRVIMRVLLFSQLRRGIVPPLCGWVRESVE